MSAFESEHLIATNKNTLICTVGRMNPPTPGHLFIIRRLLSNAVELGVDEIYVFLSSSQDNKNPLVCDETQKKHILQKMVQSLKRKMGEESPEHKSAISDIRVMIECCEKSPVVGLFEKIYEKTTALPSELIHIYITLGEDRESIKFKVEGTVFHKDYLPRPGMENALADENATKHATENATEPTVDIGSMSASLVRKIVQEGNKDRFESVYSDYLSTTDMDDLYKWIDTGLKKPPKSPKTRPKSVKRKRDINEKKSPKSSKKRGGRKSRKIDFKNKHK